MATSQAAGGSMSWIGYNGLSGQPFGYCSENSLFPAVDVFIEPASRSVVASRVFLGHPGSLRGVDDAERDALPKADTLRHRGVFSQYGNCCVGG